MPGFEYYTTKPNEYGGAESGATGGYFLDPEYIKDMALDELAAEYVQGLKTRSEHAYQQRKSRMLDYLHHYLCRPRPRKYRDQSNIPLAMATEAVDAHHHAIMNRFAQLRQHVCKVQPSPINPSERSKRTARLVDAKLYVDNMLMQWENVANDISKAALIFGSAPVQVVFTEEMQETTPAGLEGLEGNIDNLQTQQTVHEGYAIRLIDPIDYYPAPEKMFVNDYHPDLIRTFMSFEELLQANEQGAGFFNLKKIEEKRRAVPDYANEERQQRRSLLGLPGDEDSLANAIEVLQAHCWFPVGKSEKKEGEYVYAPTIITVANGCLIGLKKNPDPDNMMCMAKLDNVPGAFWGTGIIEKIHPQIHAGNTVLDLVLENIASTVHRMRAVMMDALVDPSELYSRPDGIIRFKAQYGRINDVIQELSASPLGAEVFKLLDFFMTGSERTSGASDVFKGTSSPGVETAEESRNLAGFSSMHNEYYLNRLESTFVRPSHEKGQYVNINYCSFPMWFAVGGPLAGEVVQIKNSRDLASRVMFVGLASSIDRERRTALQQAAQFLEIVKGHPALEPTMGRVVAKIVEAFNWPDQEEFKKLLDIGWKQYGVNKRMELQGLAADGPRVQPQQGAGMRTPMSTGGAREPGAVTSQPNKVSRATNESEVSRNLATMSNVGLPGKFGRR